jgi:hypothetical protein
MADLNFPLDPQLGDTYTIGNRTWVWNGYGWQIQTSITSLDPFTAKRIIVTTSTFATNTVSGGLQVVGGVGIGGNLVVGSGAITRGVINANAYATGSFAAAGDAQAGTYILRKLINSTTPTALTTDNLTAGAQNQIILPNNSSYTFRIMITARATTTNDEGAWEFSGAVTRNASAGTIAIKVSNKTKIWSSIAGYDVNLGVDVTYGALQILATGADSNPVRFVARAETVEVTT